MGNWYPRRYTVSRKHDIAAAAAPPAYFARRWPDRQRRAVADRTYSAPIGSKAAGAAFEDTWTLDKEDVAWMGLIADQHQDPPPTDNSDNWRSHRVSGIGCMVVGASAVGYGGRFVLVQYRSLSKSEAVNAGDCTVRSTHGLTEEFSPRGVSRSEAGSVSFVGRHQRLAGTLHLASRCEATDPVQHSPAGITCAAGRVALLAAFTTARCARLRSRSALRRCSRLRSGCASRCRRFLSR